ncbi:hypothetical protein P7K49_036860 [Saguinus oedipus]|uniref:Uncharacterized protein n=1 Tax=Saguinus oedipus TaxID=9490 RepID=A0ABQ9TLW2_SAGOE|nr:hypothetical protein P7K49_036860 [Saguinus oedipus]
MAAGKHLAPGKGKAAAAGGVRPEGRRSEAPGQDQHVGESGESGPGPRGCTAEASAGRVRPPLRSTWATLLPGCLHPKLSLSPRISHALATPSVPAPSPDTSSPQVRLLALGDA